MAEAVRYGLVGYGSGGRIFHAPLIAAAPGIDFVGVVTRSPQRRAELPDGLQAFDSLADIAEAGVRAVTISTPAATHAELAHEAIRLGLAVVVDKPFALTAESARAVTTAAADAGVLLSVYQNRRWDSDQLTLKRLLDEGALGEVTRYESRFERWRPSAKAGAWRDELSSEEGGGVRARVGAAPRRVEHEERRAETPTGGGGRERGTGCSGHVCLTTSAGGDDAARLLRRTPRDAPCEKDTGARVALMEHEIAGMVFARRAPEVIEADVVQRR